eukprot:2753857-Lingulodinium_polyedra.AAC.1
MSLSRTAQFVREEKRKAERYDFRDDGDAMAQEANPEAMVGSFLESLHEEWLQGVLETGGDQPVCEEPDPE